MTADQQTVDESTEQHDEQQQLGSFTGEFRDLARQKRFQRDGETAGDTAPDAASDDGTDAKPRRSRRPKARAAMALPAMPASDDAAVPTVPFEHLLPPQPQPRSAFTRVRSNGALHEQPRVAAHHAPVGAETYNPMTELSRMADRVIESREQLAAERARASRAERDLGAMNDRMLAARALVHEAQRTARMAAERCTFLEGRCDALQEALDQALTATLFRRWHWKRALRAGRQPRLG